MSDADEWDALTAFTPARIALGRAGNGLPTKRVLEFQLAHARARDAVMKPFDAQAVAQALAPHETVRLGTKALDRTTYLADPRAGRVLNDASRAQLQPGAFDAVLAIADGLSSTAIHAHGADLAHAIFAALPALRWAPTAIVTNGRVAVGDDIAEALDAEFAVVMIGERPGLSAADSVGLYLTRRPRVGLTKDAERNCISNVRPGGLALEDAARRLAWLISQAQQIGATGIALKEDAPLALTGGTAHT
jgi:ethanolamine ammonia-lyase small subunit